MNTKHLLITGTSSGLGEALTEFELTQGNSVTGLSRTSPPKLTQWQENFPNQFHHISIDLKDCHTLNDQLQQTFPPQDKWDALINNAAFAYDDLVTNLQLQPLEDMFKINVYAPMILSRFFIRRCLLHRHPAKLIHISSICAHQGFKGLAMYAATKGALEAFSLNLDQEWKRYQIRSTTVAPGFMPTQMTQSLSPEQIKKIEARNGISKINDIVEEIHQKLIDP